MKVTTKQLRIEPGRIISQIDVVKEITITYRGKPRAKIVPIGDRRKAGSGSQEDELFGIWKDRKDLMNVDQHIRNIRKGRKLC